MTRGEFAEAVFALCQEFNGSVTSWIRSTARNKRVGGVPNSAHRFGLGCDVVYDTPVNKVTAEEFAKSVGLKLLREGDHDHLQPLYWVAG